MRALREVADRVAFDVDGSVITTSPSMFAEIIGSRSMSIGLR
jgi:hypothetical protein